MGANCTQRHKYLMKSVEAPSANGTLDLIIPLKQPETTHDLPTTENDGQHHNSPFSDEYKKSSCKPQ
jgi:hypothetical protein